ncbi:MAG: hypothetical protein ACLR1R_12320 [Ruminococcus callidus]
MALPFFNKKNAPKDETGTIVLPEQLPQHVGFIMDGNGRWANQTWYATKVWTSGRSKKFQRPVPVLSGYWSAKCIFLCFLNRKLETSTR